MTFLTLHAISKSFGGVVALDGIDLAVPAGSRTVIVGPSASGKTTLLRIIAGFDAPDDGVVALDGRVLADALQTVPAYRRGIGYVAQDGALFPHLTVAANIGFGLDLQGAARQERIAELLAMVELPSSVLQRRPDQLSGGQQQRVAIARALAQQPRLMLLDEPFSALDTGLREATRKAVGKILSAAGITTILVTHDQNEALTFADQVAVLQNGRLAQAGSPREVYAEPKSTAVASYLGDAIVLDADVADGFARCALGRLRTAASARRGPGTVMLRPEQVRVVDVEEMPASGGARAVTGEVVDIDYAGAYSALTVRLGGANGYGDSGPAWGGPIAVATSIVVKTFAPRPPPIGAIVRLHVEGCAHVFHAAADDESE